MNSSRRNLTVQAGISAANENGSGCGPTTIAWSLNPVHLRTPPSLKKEPDATTIAWDRAEVRKDLFQGVRETQNRGRGFNRSGKVSGEKTRATLNAAEKKKREDPSSPTDERDVIGRNFIFDAGGRREPEGSRKKLSLGHRVRPVRGGPHAVDGREAMTCRC